MVFLYIKPQVTELGAKIWFTFLINLIRSGKLCICLFLLPQIYQPNRKKISTFIELHVLGAPVYLFNSMI
jgi:hypothetical protein